MEPSTLNETYIPKTLIRKSNARNENPMVKAPFDKTDGNVYIEFEPAEVKFQGYELNTTRQAQIRVINKAPIPQRIHILPPTEECFSIKVNKKGAIPTGMFETIRVFFKSNEHKYQYDVIKINTETENFVIPIYAYPSLPPLRDIFPKTIDFGSIQIGQAESNFYPINNSVPINFPYEFSYQKESSAFIITPLEGIIEGNKKQMIEITFVPTQKSTYTAKIYLHVKQFDFKPLQINILGTGRDKKISKRVKSSKLKPMKQQQRIQTPLPLESSLSAKKTFIRSSFPKLLKRNIQQTITNERSKRGSSLKNIGERDFLGRFSKVQELDKEKAIKFAHYLGEQAMTEEELENQNKIINQQDFMRRKNYIEACIDRHQPYFSSDASIQYRTFQPKIVSWDDNKNDELKQRKERLEKFMKAGSKIIEKYRLEKRLGKIKKFLENCHSKKQVAQKVEEDYNKSQDAGRSNAKSMKLEFDFSMDSLAPCCFPIQYKQNNELNTKTFEIEGKPQFDDNDLLPELTNHRTQTMNLDNAQYSSDFFYLSKNIPDSRKSAEEEYPFRTASLPEYKPVPLSSIYMKPLKMPPHQFIHDNYDFRRYKALNPIDEKDPDYLIDSQIQEVQDEFQGWPEGDFEVLKAKFQRNLGCQFSSISKFSGTGMTLPIFQSLGNNLPKEIPHQYIQGDDIIEDGDSDQQKDPKIVLQKTQQAIEIMEKNSPQTQKRRQKIMQNYEQSLLTTINKNLQSIKLQTITKGTDAIESFNEWVKNPQHRILL